METPQFPLEQAIAHYQTALSAVELLLGKSAAVESEDLSAFKKDVLELLIARDAVEQQRQAIATQGINGSTYILLLDLDERLGKLGEAIATHVPLENYRKSLKPPESSWWWFFNSSNVSNAPSKLHKHDQFDWAWNALTVVFLVFSTSFATNTAKAFSTQGFDLLGTFSTISQGAGLALVAGGVLTDKGKRVAENILHSLKVPPHFYAEATCGFSFAILGTTALINSNLPAIGDLYYSSAEKSLQNGDLITAASQYERALQFNPGNSELHVALGKVSEAQGDLQTAQTHHENGRKMDNPGAMSGLGRVLILQSLEEAGWTAKLDDKVNRQVDLLLYTAIATIKQKGLSTDASADHTTLVDIYTNYGILNLVGFEMQPLYNMSEDAKEAALEKLDSATANFECAVNPGLEGCYSGDTDSTLEEISLRDEPNPQQDLARCYLKVVEQTRQEISYQEGQNLNQAYEESNDCYYELSIDIFNDTIMVYRSDFDWGIPGEAYEAVGE